jgi:hypothetical protein
VAILCGGALLELLLLLLLGVVGPGLLRLMFIRDGVDGVCGTGAVSCCSLVSWLWCMACRIAAISRLAFTQCFLCVDKAYETRVGPVADELLLI